MSTQRLRVIATVAVVIACLAQAWLGDLWLAFLFTWLGITLATIGVDKEWITKSEDQG